MKCIDSEIDKPVELNWCNETSMWSYMPFTKQLVNLDIPGTCLSMGYSQRVKEGSSWEYDMVELKACDITAK